MAQKTTKTARTLENTGVASTTAKPLGIYTELQRPGDEQNNINVLSNPFQKHLDKLGKIILHNNELGLRDKFTLGEVSKAIIRHYQKYIKSYKKFVKGKRTPQFKRNTFCGNILTEMSAVKMTTDTNSIVNTHIAHCASTWLCPVCSSIIQSRRANEVQRAIDWANGISLIKDSNGDWLRIPNDNDYQVVMITYTASHNVKMSLIEFGKQLQNAFIAMNKNIRKSRKKYEVGNIKGVEFTHSYKNGWHKHFHVIYILKKECDVDSFFATIQKSWENACAKNNLLDSTNERAVQDFRKHSVNLVKDATEISNYVNKSSEEWTLADEMSKSILKIGHNTEHRTPFQILSDIATTKDKVQRYKDINVFIEYMCYTFGLHQQDWSNGLKSAVGLYDVTDEEIMEQQEEHAFYIAGLTVAHWHLIRSKYQRIQYLQAAKGGYESLKAFFDTLDKNLPDLLTGEQARAYEKYNEIQHTSDEFEKHKLLRTILYAIKESQPMTYQSSDKPFNAENYKHNEKIFLKESVQNPLDTDIFSVPLKPFDEKEYNKNQDMLFNKLLKEGKTQLLLFE